MRTLKIISLYLLLLILSLHAIAFDKIFYLTPHFAHSRFSDDQLRSITAHAKFIDIIAPHIYQIDGLGSLSGKIDLRLINLAKKNNIKLMPTVRNFNFSNDEIVHFLNNPIAEKKSIIALLAQCRQYHFYGMQIDFESITLNEKNGCHLKTVLSIIV